MTNSCELTEFTNVIMERDSSQPSQQSPSLQSSTQTNDGGSDFFKGIEFESFSINDEFDESKCKEIVLEAKRAHSSTKSLEADALDHLNRLRNEELQQDTLIQEQKVKGNEHERMLASLGGKWDASAERLEKANKAKPIIQYEVQRIRVIHEDQKQQTTTIKVLNEDVVQPVLEKKRMEFNVTMEDVSKTNKELAKAVDLLEALTQQNSELESNHDSELMLLQERKSMESALRSLPQDFQKEIEVMHKKAKHIREEVARSEEQVYAVETKVTSVNDGRMRMENIKNDVVAKLDEGRQKGERSHDERESISKALVLAQTKFHSITASRVQMEIKFREATEDVRHQSAGTSLQRKQLDQMMRLFLKKKIIVERCQKSVEEMLVQLTDEKHIVKTKQALWKDQSKDIEVMKDSINIKMTRLLEQTNVEEEVKTDVNNLLTAIEEGEGEVDRWRIEVKKLSKIMSVLNNQREIQRRKTKVIVSEGKETLETVKLKTFAVLDMEKALRETNTRSRELRVLYESLRRQKSQLVAASSASSLSLSEVKIRIASSTIQLQSLQRGQDEKMSMLLEEKNSHENSKKRKAMLRVDKTKATAKFRERQEANERVGGQIDKLKSVLGNLQRDIIHEKTRNRLLINRNRLMSEQLSDKKIEYHSLLKRENIQEEILKKRELAIQQKRQDIKAIRIQYLDAERFVNSRTNLDVDIQEKKEKNEEFKEQLQAEAKQLHALSECIENPTKAMEIGRWRGLGGNDLDSEQLYAKSQILSQRLGENKEQLVERDAILDQIQCQKQLIENDVDLIRIKAQPSVKQLNDCQARVRESTRSMMALISELSMYQATALKLEEEKEDKQDFLTNCCELVANGQPPTLNALKALQRLERHQKEVETSMNDSSYIDRKAEQNEFGKLYYPAKNALRTTAEPRPTAYIPECGLELPTPYGRMAPFKPCEFRSSHSMSIHETITQMQ